MQLLPPPSTPCQRPVLGCGELTWGPALSEPPSCWRSWLLSADLGPHAEPQEGRTIRVHGCPHVRARRPAWSALGQGVQPPCEKSREREKGCQRDWGGQRRSWGHSLRTPEDAEPPSPPPAAQACPALLGLEPRAPPHPLSQATTQCSLKASHVHEVLSQGAGTGLGTEWHVANIPVQ